jgi:eukaryotic-like serine/threonine-protein kinase
MGEVWKARDTRLGRIVAIKRLKGEHRARFQQEAHAIAALNHPHICQIYDAGPDYLVMEYIEGQSLRGPLQVEDALRIAIQIVSALEEAHSRQILHRDLKPGNILVTKNGTAKLLDFGLAKLIRPPQGAEITETKARSVAVKQRGATESRTENSALLAASGQRVPLQPANGDSRDPRVWASGAIRHELAGREGSSETSGSAQMLVSNPVYGVSNQMPSSG